MGRYGEKILTDSVPSLSIFWLKKQGYLCSGKTGTLIWSNRYMAVDEISFRVEIDCIVMDSGEKILFDYKQCYYGSERRYFLCPECDRRVALLYKIGRFMCRHCHNLSYASQRESRGWRELRKVRSIRERVGASSDLREPILLKPKGMHLSTFTKLRQQEALANSLAWSAMR